MDENWIDISYSMTVAKLKGCRLMKNISTGETKLVKDELIPPMPAFANPALKGATEEYHEKKVVEKAVQPAPVKSKK